MSIDQRNKLTGRWYITLLLFLLLQIIIYTCITKCVFMSWVDWIVLMCPGIHCGLWHLSHPQINSMEAYLRGNNENRWWEIGPECDGYTGFGHHFPVHTQSRLMKMA